MWSTRLFRSQSQKSSSNHDVPADAATPANTALHTTAAARNAAQPLGSQTRNTNRGSTYRPSWRTSIPQPAGRLSNTEEHNKRGSFQKPAIATQVRPSIQHNTSTSTTESTADDRIHATENEAPDAAQQNSHKMSQKSWTPSRMSSNVLPQSFFYSSEFMLGAGMVILQPATEKIVVVWEEKKNYWFLPKGRKDVGESLEQAAVREAYEEVYFSLILLNISTNCEA